MKPTILSAILISIIPMISWADTAPEGLALNPYFGGEKYKTGCSSENAVVEISDDFRELTLVTKDNNISAESGNIENYRLPCKAVFKISNIPNNYRVAVSSISYQYKANIPYLGQASWIIDTTSETRVNNWHWPVLSEYHHLQNFVCLQTFSYPRDHRLQNFLIQ